MNAKTEDRALVAAFLESRTNERFLPLYRRHTPRLWRVTVRLCVGREGEAEEIVQEVWARALAGLERFSWQSSLAVWLQSIALNCLRERWRSAEREELWDARHEPRATHDDEPTCFDDADTNELEAAIAALPQRARTVLVLHDIEGLTHAAIARVVGIEAGTSKSQLARARRKLRTALAPRSKETT